ncbi:hypothetical protein HLK59_29355 [Streptomyces sp. S3(2020)]|uniref:hypothetical protein n=1 Tax=Streptomyces sp. S3(2020) TaxID=2732044 RepID=UPI001489BA71|nr:hypothetical protein [Streptomyces sp. S3(2020)]NNN34398.1 hypothetical protein [Streptomyces sp. S3(2020)]
MSTDIHGGIEFRHPSVGTDYYEGEPWVGAMDLWPLYDETDYASFGCLFGVRNYAGYPPLAAERGLPADMSSALRERLQPWVADGHLAEATWVSWAEIAGMDPATTPEHYIGRLTWSSRAQPALLHQQLVPAQWPPELVAAVGPRPRELEGRDHYVEWQTGDLHYQYESLTAGSILGPRSHWPHVFAVMKALADRFGEDAVRLVVAFD